MSTVERLVINKAGRDGTEARVDDSLASLRGSVVAGRVAGVEHLGTCVLA